MLGSSGDSPEHFPPLWAFPLVILGGSSSFRKHGPINRLTSPQREGPITVWGHSARLCRTARRRCSYICRAISRATSLSFVANRAPGARSGMTWYSSSPGSLTRHHHRPFLEYMHPGSLLRSVIITPRVITQTPRIVIVDVLHLVQKRVNDKIGDRVSLRGSRPWELGGTGLEPVASCL